MNADNSSSEYDTFRTHSAKDKTVVRPLVERLRVNGRNMWFDEWEITEAEGSKRKRASELHPLAFSLQPFDAAPIKGSLAQFLCINCHHFMV